MATKKSLVLTDEVLALNWMNKMGVDAGKTTLEKLSAGYN